MLYLQVKAFGNLQFQYDGLSVEKYPTRYVEELLGFLLTQPQSKHSREKLVHLLWPDVPEVHGRNRLNTTLWRLRVILKTIHFPPDAILHSSRHQISLTSEQCVRSDFEMFQKLVRQAQVEPDMVRQAYLLRQALAHYTGDFCEGIFAEWCLAERERLARLRLRAMGQLMYCLMKMGELVEATEIGQAILQTDPLREEVHRALIQCYGQRQLYGRALRQFHLCAELLLKELNVLPMPETTGLFHEILTQRSRLIRHNLASSPELQEAFGQFQAASDKLSKVLAQNDISI